MDRRSLQRGGGTSAGHSQDPTAGGKRLREHSALHPLHLQEGNGGGLFQRHVVPAGQHHRLQLRCVRVLQQRAEVHQHLSLRRRAPPLQPAGPDGGQHADGDGVGGSGGAGGPGQDQAADADADGSGREPELCRKRGERLRHPPALRLRLQPAALPGAHPLRQQHPADPGRPGPVPGGRRHGPEGRAGVRALLHPLLRLLSAADAGELGGSSSLLHLAGWRSGRVHLLGHGDAGGRGEESHAGRRPAAQEVPGPPALHPALLQERGCSGLLQRSDRQRHPRLSHELHHVPDLRTFPAVLQELLGTPAGSEGQSPFWCKAGRALLP